MNAYVLQERELSLTNIEIPQINSGQLLIQTKAISLNPVDYKVTQGAFGLNTPRVIGIDVAGDVLEVGSKVKNVKQGDRVFGLVNIFKTGSFADYVILDSAAASIIPENVSYAEASTIPCAGITAWQAVMEKINLRKGQSIFITAGGGGVGSYAIQFAKMKGAKIITTASKDFDRLKNLGAHYIINYKKADIGKEILAITEGAGIDYMINCISANDILKYSELIRFNGSIVGITGIPKEYPFKPFTKAAGIHELALVGAYTGGDLKSLQELASAGNQIAKLISEGKVSANITKELSFDKIPAGLELFAKGNSSGKIVITKS